MKTLKKIIAIFFLTQVFSSFPIVLQPWTDLATL